MDHCTGFHVRVGVTQACPITGAVYLTLVGLTAGKVGRQA